MQFSRKADYAIRAVTLLASLGPDRSMQAQEMADAARIPIKFLEQILLVLKRGGILRSKRGVGGGYRLNRESRLITVAEVIEAVDGELVQLIDSEEYPTFAGSSGISHCLEEAERAINEKLESTSIEDIVRHDEGDMMAGYGI